MFKILKKLVLWAVIGFGALFVFGIIVALIDDDENVVREEGGGTEQVQQQAQASYAIGDTLKTKKVALIVTNASKTRRVGDEYFGSTASEGAVYIAVKFKYKNISGSSIGMFGKPGVTLLDPNGNEYEEDMGATTSYASQIGVDEKILSDLNPGITVNSCAVFEVSEEMLASAGWKIAVSANGSDFLLNIQ